MPLQDVIHHMMQYLLSSNSQLCTKTIVTLMTQTWCWFWSWWCFRIRFIFISTARFWVYHLWSTFFTAFIFYLFNRMHRTLISQLQTLNHISNKKACITWLARIKKYRSFIHENLKKASCDQLLCILLSETYIAGSSEDGCDGGEFVGYIIF